MSTISSFKSFVFCPPPLGKPDPSQPKPSEGLDTRKRVIQLGSKDNTCWYAAFNMLRERYKAPNTQDLPKRIFEQTASSMRKAISAYDRSLPDVANQLNNNTIKNYFTILTQEQVANPLVQKTLEELDKQCSPEVSLCSILPDFLKQEKYRNLYDYLIHLKIHKRQDIYNQFFIKLNIDPKNLLKEAKKLDQRMYYYYCEENEWENLDSHQKSTLLDHFSRHLCAKHYNMKISSWHPRQSIEHLIKELKERGPLIVGGLFGSAHYAVPPSDLGKKIENRTVYGWTKNDPKNIGHATAHTILLVGAEKTTTREFVYYIDPVDDSDPSHLEKQRIYCMSYEKLTSAENICDYHGFLRKDAPETIGYAVYREKITEKTDQ